jgi:hypothetical protein
VLCILDPNKQYIEFFTLPIATWKTEVENAVQHLEAATTEYQVSSIACHEQYQMV